MSREKYRKIGIALTIGALLQYFILGCIVSTKMDVAWLESASRVLMCALLAGGIGMIIISRNDKSYKKSMIEDKDERNKLINLNACAVTLFVAFISYVGVFVYMKNAGIIAGMQIVIFCIPILIGCLVYGLSTLYLKKRI